MEEQLAELMAQVTALKESSGVTNTMFAETFYRHSPSGVPFDMKIA